MQFENYFVILMVLTIVVSGVLAFCLGMFIRQKISVTPVYTDISSKNHPYYCSSCNYSVIGQVALGVSVCPECNAILEYDHNDQVLARALVSKLKISTIYAQYVIYEYFQHGENKYFQYVDNVYAMNKNSAYKYAKSRYTRDIVVVNASIYPSSNGHILITPILVVPEKPKALVNLDGTCSNVD